jgi:uncharacterized protein YndB with AHSA1/START domain
MMPETEKQIITVTVTINAPLMRVWDMFTGPQNIIHWNNASDDWLTSYAENDLKTGGKFLFRMEARDGSSRFDFTGKYDKVISGKSIMYTITDGRKVKITFNETAGRTQVTESFEPEHLNTAGMQKTGWQAILDNFKKYVESYGKREIQHFEITIENTADNVFWIMLASETYKEWTSVFNPVSHFIGSWDKGKKILFLGTDAEGRTGGMVSRIRENIPGRFLSIEYLGEVIDGKEITSEKKADVWRGSLENYSFNTVGNKTLLSVDIDVPGEFRSYFSETWPKALEKLKLLCE